MCILLFLFLYLCRFCLLFVFVFFLLLSLELGTVDVPLTFFCPADHVPDWQPRILLGMVEARSVNVKKSTTTPDSGERMRRDKIHHNEFTQHIVSLHGGHVVPSALQSSTATTVKKAVVVWNNSWSRRHAPQMMKNLLPVHIIRRQKATSEDICTNHPVCCLVGNALELE